MAEHVYTSKISGVSSVFKVTTLEKISRLYCEIKSIKVISKIKTDIVNYIENIFTSVLIGYTQGVIEASTRNRKRTWNKIFLLFYLTLGPRSGKIEFKYLWIWLITARVSEKLHKIAE